MQKIICFSENRKNLHFQKNRAAENAETNEEGKGGESVAGREPNPARDKGLEIFLQTNGEISNGELAELTGATADQIRKWKCVYKWKEKLAEVNKPKRGGQPGNQNAKGHGAKKGNENAVTHGAYKTVGLEDLPPLERERIENITLDPEENLLQELRLLLAKESDLRERVENLQRAPDTDLYVDKVVEMLAPKSKEDIEAEQERLYALENMGVGGMEEEKERIKQSLKTAMNTVIKSSPFERALKLEAELNKTHGRILKLLDTVKSYKLESRRLSLEEKRYTLMKQKITGAFEIGDDGEIDDTYREIDEGDEGV